MPQEADYSYGYGSYYGGGGASKPSAAAAAGGGGGGGGSMARYDSGAQGYAGGSGGYQVQPGAAESHSLLLLAACFLCIAAWRPRSAQPSLLWTAELCVAPGLCISMPPVPGRPCWPALAGSQLPSESCCVF